MGGRLEFPFGQKRRTQKSHRAKRDRMDYSGYGDFGQLVRFHTLMDGTNQKVFPPTMSYPSSISRDPGAAEIGRSVVACLLLGMLV